MSYAAMAPIRGVGAFIAGNRLNFRFSKVSNAFADAN
jgi:hypothetical protein